MHKNALVIYNPYPASSVGPDLWLGQIVHNLCNRGGYQVSVLATEANMNHQSLDVAEIANYQRIIAAGGDGTVRLVLATLAYHKLPIPVGIIPLGTGNQLARNLSIYEDNLLTDPLETAIEIALQGEPLSIDLGLMNGEYFAVAAGTGPLSDAVIFPDPKDKATWKMLAYASSMIRTFALPPVTFKLNVDGDLYQVTASGLFVTNVSDLGVGKLSDTAVLDDGLLDLCILNPSEFNEYLELGFRFAGGFVGGEAPYYIRKVRSVNIDVEPVRTRLSRLQKLGQEVRNLIRGRTELRARNTHTTAMIDGDACGTTPMHIEVVPKAVNVLVSKNLVT